MGWESFEDSPLKLERGSYPTPDNKNRLSQLAVADRASLHLDAEVTGQWVGKIIWGRERSCLSKSDRPATPLVRPTTGSLPSSSSMAKNSKEADRMIDLICPFWKKELHMKKREGGQE